VRRIAFVLHRKDMLLDSNCKWIRLEGSEGSHFGIEISKFSEQLAARIICCKKFRAGDM